MTPAEKLRNSVVGSFELSAAEAQDEGTTAKIVFFENGKVESYKGNGEKGVEGTWKLVEKEVHVVEEGTSLTAVFKIEQNGDLTCIAYIENGKRTDIPKEVQVLTFKKLKE